MQSKRRAKEKPGNGPQAVEHMPHSSGQTSESALKCDSVKKPSTDPGPKTAGSETTAIPGRLEDLALGQKIHEGQSTDERTVVTPAAGSGNSIIVSPRQVQNL